MKIIDVRKIRKAEKQAIAKEVAKVSDEKVKKILNRILILIK